MEGSKLPGDSEECSSSESGWTMYLTSPMHEDGDEHDGDDGQVEVVVDDDDDDGSSKDSSESEHGHEGDEDDSMASDASTGPAHNKHSCRTDGKDVMVHEDQKHHQGYYKPQQRKLRFSQSSDKKVYKNKDEEKPRGTAPRGESVAALQGEEDQLE